VKIKTIILVLLTTIVLGGCNMTNGKDSAAPSEMDPKDLPDVPAFQDEFTRSFLTSTEPVRECYYPFEAKSGKFTMEFPGDMSIGERSYNISPKNNSEFINISHTDESLDVFTNIQIKYYGFMSSEESSKEGMSAKSNENLDFQPLESRYKGQRIETADLTDTYRPTFATLIWNDNNENVQIFMDMSCKEGISSKECSQMLADEKERILRVLQSIKLTQSKGE
jgi:hypothetical protein